MAKPIMMGCLLLMIAGCATVKQKIQAHNDVDPEVNNIVWEISYFKGLALNARNFGNGLPFISFDMEDGKISGNDGCNNFIGVAAYHNHTIKTGAIASTKMACPNNSIQDDLYTIMSSPGLTYHLDKGVLRLFVNDAEVMALRERE
jgi:heat shock protein HslJ